MNKSLRQKLIKCVSIQGEMPFPHPNGQTCTETCFVHGAAPCDEDKHMQYMQGADRTHQVDTHSRGLAGSG